MRIVIDSADGCGKSSLIEKLCDEYGTDVLHLTKPGYKQPIGYVEKAALSNMILDRGFTSEYVYSNYYSRPSEITKEVFENLLFLYRKIYGWNIIFLYCKPEVAKERIEQRGIDSEPLEKLEAINMLYKTLSVDYDIPIIDTSDLTKEQVFEKAKELINERN